MLLVVGIYNMCNIEVYTILHHQINCMDYMLKCIFPSKELMLFCCTSIQRNCYRYIFFLKISKFFSEISMPLVRIEKLIRKSVTFLSNCSK